MANGQKGEQIFEALFRQAVIDDYMEEIESIPSNKELARMYPFSPEFERRMKKLFARERIKEVLRSAGIYAKKAAIIFVFTATALLVALFSSPRVRAVVRDIVVEWYEQFTSFKFGNETSDYVGQKEFYPEYLPDGYFEGSVESLGNYKAITFLNEAGDEIRFSYFPDSNSTNLSVDNEHHIIEETVIKGNTAFIIEATDESFYNGLILHFEGYVIEIWGKAPPEVLVKVVESVSERK